MEHCQTADTWNNVCVAVVDQQETGFSVDKELIMELDELPFIGETKKKKKAQESKQLVCPH